MYDESAYGLAVNLIIHILHTALLKKVLDTFLSAEEKNRLVWKPVFAGYYLLMTAACRMFYVSLPYGLCNLACIIGITCFYRAAWEKKIWISMVFFCMNIGCGAAAASACPAGAGMQQSAVWTLFLLGCVLVICRIPDPEESRKTGLAKKQMFLLIVIPMTSAAAFFGLMDTGAGRRLSFFLCAVLLLLNLCVFDLYHILLKNYVQLREQDIYKQQTAAYQNQLEVIMESQGRIRALRHDMKNHVLTLQGLAKGAKQEEMMEYLVSMQQFMQNPSEYVYTGNEDLDSLLNFKLLRAQEELKKVETDIVIPEKMKLHSFDFNVIVGNLLDNAVTASMQTEERFLKFSMRMENGVLFLYMVNSCRDIPDGRCEIQKLSEKSAAGHGIGLANVKRVVEKYHGDMEMRCQKNHMETEILLYMKNL